MRFSFTTLTMVALLVGFSACNEGGSATVTSKNYQLIVAFFLKDQ